MRSRYAGKCSGFFILIWQIHRQVYICTMNGQSAIRLEIESEWMERDTFGKRAIINIGTDVLLIAKDRAGTCFEFYFGYGGIVWEKEISVDSGELLFKRRSGKMNGETEHYFKVKIRVLARDLKPSQREKGAIIAELKTETAV